MGDNSSTGDCISIISKIEKGAIVFLKMTTNKKNKFPIEWQPWARTQSLGCAGILFLGGLISLFYPKKYFAIANIFIAFIMMLLEYPAPFIKNLGPIANNYYLRALLYSAALVPAMIQAPTQTPGLCLCFAILTYFRAAINQEPQQCKKAK